MQALHSPRQNRLLARVPATDYEQLLPNLELASFPLGWAVYEAGGPHGYLYFPTTSIVSLPRAGEAGDAASIAVIGNEGMIGTTLFTGGESTTGRAVVLKEGHAYRLKGSLLKDEFARGGPLQHLLLRFTQALVAQAAQTDVCSRNHSVDQQLCRWLLLSLDRLPSNELTMTQDLVANMLGVRREGATVAAGRLQEAGLISASRGMITVLDRPKLEAMACECYSVVRRETDRLFPASIF